MRHLLFIATIVTLALSGGCGDDDDAGSNDAFIGCIKRLACGVLDYPRVSNCVDNYKTTFNDGYRYGEAEEARLKCAAGATSCDKVRSCYGEGSTYCDVTYKATCSGGKATYCETVSHKTYVYNCEVVGLGCQVDSSGPFNAWCTGGGSTPGLPTSPSCGGDLCEATVQTCDGNTDDMCSGGKVKSCLGGTWVLFDCKHLGLGDCVTAGGFASCGLFN